MSLVSFEPGWKIADALTHAQAVRALVTIHLEGGSTLVGRVAGVGRECLILSELSGREFFDAFISLDRIVALEARSRDA